MQRLIGCLLIAGASLLAQAPQGALVAYVDAIRKVPLALASKVSDLQPVQVGHAAFTFGPGLAASLDTGSGAKGLFVRGSGRLVFRSALAFERSSFDYNVRENTSLKVQRKGEERILDIPVDEALIWSCNVPLPAVAPGADKSLQEYLQDHLRAFEYPVRPQAAPRLAVSALNGPAQKVLVAEIRSGASRYLYTYDETQSQMERLDLIQEDDSRRPEYTSLVRLSGQPIGWDWREPIHAKAYLRDVQLEVQHAGGEKGRVTATETLNLRVPARVLRLSLLNYVTADHGSAALKHGAIRLNAVKDAAGRALPFVHEGHSLLVELPGLMAAGSSVTLRFEMEGEMFLGPVGTKLWNLQTSSWFPLTEDGGDAYTLKAVIRTPKGYVPVAPGRTVRREDSAEGHLLEVALDRPSSNFVVTAGDYHPFERMMGDIKLSYWQYSTTGESTTVDTLFRVLGGHLRTFSQLRPFPHKELVIVESGLSAGGTTAIPGMIFRNGNPTTRDTSHVAWAHHNDLFEVARQYWGQDVKFYAPSERWVVAGLSAYSAALFVKGLPKYGPQWFDYILSVYRKDLAQVEKGLCLADSFNLSTRNPRRTRDASSLLYAKSVLFFHQVCQEVGEPAFARFMQAFLERGQGKLTKASDVKNFLEVVTGKPMGPLFDRYVYGPEIPSK